MKSFLNPMFISMIVGMIIGLVKIPMPNWIESIISVSANCMSPIAMLLTGVAISFISLKDTFTNIRIYLLCIVKLIIMPLLFVGVTYFVKLPSTVYISLYLIFSTTSPVLSIKPHLPASFTLS